MSAARTPPTDEQIRAATFITARLGGCTCQPSIKLRRVGQRIVQAEIAHDSDCGHPSQQKDGTHE